MKQKIHYLFMLLLMLLTGVGGVKAQEEVFYTLTPTKGSNNGYAANCDITINGMTWNVTGNSTTTPWRIGGKSITNTDRAVYSKTAMGSVISKVELTVGDASSITVNSLKLIVASDADYKSQIDEVSANFSANSKISFTPKSGTEWASDAYYKFVFNVTVSGSSNKFVEFIEAKFYKPESSGPADPMVSFANERFEVAKGKSAVNEIRKPSDLTVTYESSKPDVASVDATTGEVTGVAIGDATITAKWNDVEGKYNKGSKSYSVVVREPTPQELALLYESWSKSLAANDGNDELGVRSSNLDYNNWKEFSKVYQGAGQCGKLGTSSAIGKMTTNEIALTGNGTLTFKIKKYGSDSGKLKVSATGATIVGVFQFTPASTDEWTDCTINLVNGNGEVTIVLETTSKRMYIDDIMLLEAPTYTIDVVSNNTSYGSVSMENNVITASPAEGCRFATPAYTVTSGEAEIEQDGNTFIVTAKSDCQVQINFEKIPTHTVTFSVNGTETSKQFSEGSPITFDTPDDVQGKQFVGWTTATIDGTTDECPELVTLGTMGNADVTYYAVFANVTAGTATSTVDDLTQTTTGVTGTSYTEWSGKKVTSDAIYAGQSAGGNESIQLRSNNSNSGVVSTTSGGKLKKVVVVWNGETADGRTLNVYGKNSAYSAATDLYGDNAGTLLGTIVKGTSTELTISGDYEYVGLRSASGAMYLNSISITWENGTPDTYSDYCTTVVAPVKPAKPIIFHDDGGEYEGELTVAIAGEGVKYTLNDGAEETYAGPFTISDEGEYTIKAWAEKDGVKSDVAEKTFTIVEKTYDGDTFDGYYTIKNNNGNNMFVNVAGRKTVTFESETADKAGTVIRVKTNDKGQVEVLRSQGVDVPGYAEKAMRYVPEIVKLVVNKLNNLGEGQLMGEAGLEALMNKFNDAFDEHLYLEKAGENSYRIYGRTPSMKHVVDFYAENKANVDAKLPMLEGKINAAIEKVLQKTNGSGQSILVPFKLKTVWQNMGGTLTEPVDEASTMKFYEEVLTSETNVWNFAYQTAMIYWGNLKNNDTFKNYIKKLGDYAKYINKVENIRPNFKYYIVQKDNKLDIISEGNGELNADFTAWTLIPRTDFSVAFNEENVLNNKYYTTLYTDFAYTLPEGKGVKAYKVTKVSEAGVAVKVEMKGIIPAQTPVLLESESAEAQTLLLSTEDGTAPADNILVGADALINQYQIKTAQVEDLFNFAKDILGESFYNTYIQKYEHLMLRYAGTVNNKYFFGLTEDDVDKCTELNEAGKKTCVIRSLSMGDKKLGFYNNWEAKANQAFLVTKDFNPVKLFLVGDVNRDGNISIADVTALVDIILGKATYPEDNDKYDFAAANVNNDKAITISDVTALVNIILGK